MSSVSLSVTKWSAWAPGVSDSAGWKAWAKGELSINGPVEPDVKFVAPMMRRRLSGLSRMGFRVAADCLEKETGSPMFVFCSRYGEYTRSFGLLENFAAGQPASAAAFSMSVHNTASSLFSIETNDQSSSTALSGGEATLETGFVEAWSLLVNQVATSVLLVYHDERLPELYREQTTSVMHAGAIALVLKLPDSDSEGIRLNLGWATDKSTDENKHVTASDPALEVLRLLVNGSGAFVLDTGRLVWTWDVVHVAH